MDELWVEETRNMVADEILGKRGIASRQRRSDCWQLRSGKKRSSDGVGRRTSWVREKDERIEKHANTRGHGRRRTEMTRNAQKIQARAGDTLRQPKTGGDGSETTRYGRRWESGNLIFGVRWKKKRMRRLKRKRRKMRQRSK
ncbi:arginine-glutamic acid dipeptide repeats protein [Striga asiatica]|uniref:60S ribosomal protein L41 n=1 Tax=Striga asiatica TaxID=4170 RepID=A0A5A7PYU7_STRAF|nr:arginine-glutamic acid dipeptide repeats protein [Striga asiatica]